MTGDAGEQLALLAAEPDPDEPAEGFHPTPAQREAIACRDRDVFTEAGAGSGKTGVLVERYCDCVTEDGLGPEEILAFTFTERAAAELRQRVRRQLIERAHAAAERGDLERARDIARAAREGERAWITTIHGFCRRVLAAHPVAAHMDPRFRVLDDSEASRLRERAFAAAVEEVVEREGEPAASFVAAFWLPRLRDLVVDVHERLRSQGVDPPRLPDPGPPARSVKDKDETRELTPVEKRRASEGLAAFSALLASYDDAYRRLKTERSGADFGDLELRAVELLSGSGAVAEAWRDRFSHLMVDEFQDTNRVQLGLINALRDPETRLFVVGDEYQSIYRFRHADLEVFREQRAAARRRRDDGRAAAPRELPLAAGCARRDRLPRPGDVRRALRAARSGARGGRRAAGGRPGDRAPDHRHVR